MPTERHPLAAQGHADRSNMSGTAAASQALTRTGDSAANGVNTTLAASLVHVGASGATVAAPTVHGSDISALPIQTRESVDSQSSKTVCVPMGELINVTDAVSVLNTRGLTDCSALVVLTNRKGDVFEARTLMHLSGSSLDSPLSSGGKKADPYSVIDALTQKLKAGGKVIWVAGCDSKRPSSLRAALNQKSPSGIKVLHALMNQEKIERHFVTGTNIMVYPDGTFHAEKDAQGKEKYPLEILPQEDLPKKIQ